MFVLPSGDTMVCRQQKGTTVLSPRKGGEEDRAVYNDQTKTFYRRKTYPTLFPGISTPIPGCCFKEDTHTQTKKEHQLEPRYFILVQLLHPHSRFFEPYFPESWRIVHIYCRLVSL